MGTKGPTARGLASWMARAKSSLPVPVSASKSTGRSDEATRDATRLASVKRASVPRIGSNAGGTCALRSRRARQCGGSSDRKQRSASVRPLRAITDSNSMR